MPRQKPIQWDDLLRQYARDGALIPPQQVNSWVQRFVGSAMTELEHIAVAHQQGKLSRAEWVIQHGELMRVLHRSTAMIAYGGKAQMAQAEWGRVGAVMRREYGYFNAFVNELDNLPEGKTLGAGFIARAKSYARAGYATYENSVRRREQQAGRQTERLILGVAEHCPDCLSDAAQGEVPIGTLRAIGERQCITGCHCHFEYGGGTYFDQTPVGVKVKMAARTQRTIERMLGRPVTPMQIAQMAGAIDGATVTVRDLHPAIHLRVTHPHIKDMQRYLQKDQDGKAYVNNVIFRKKENAPAGIGLRAFTTQVAAAKRLGISYLRTYAAGVPGDPVYNGYYTWARFGYNAQLDQPELDGLPENLKSARSLNDLLLLPGGAEWWKANGSHRAMHFSLAEDSRSMKILRNYIRNKRRQ